MKFDDFTKKLKVKDYAAGGEVEVDDYKLNFAKVYLRNKLIRFNDNHGFRQAGRSLHNSLTSLYNYVYNDESSLIVVFNTQDKQRLVREFESLTRQLGIKDKVVYSHNYSHNYLNIMSLLAWKDQSRILNNNYNHIFIDNAIIDQYHDFLHGDSHYKGGDFFTGLCKDFTDELNSVQNKKLLKSVNCLRTLNKKEIVTSEGTSFKESDIFTIARNANEEAYDVATLIKINYDKSISWASTVDILLKNVVIQMPAHNLEYFVKL